MFLTTVIPDENKIVKHLQSEEHFSHQETSAFRIMITDANSSPPHQPPPVISGVVQDSRWRSRKRTMVALYLRN